MKVAAHPGILGLQQPQPEVLLEPGDAAELLGVSTQRVRQLADEGRLPPVAVTRRGSRLFRREDVDRLVAERGRVTGVAVIAAPPGAPPTRGLMLCDVCGSEYPTASRGPFPCNSPGCGGTVSA